MGDASADFQTMLCNAGLICSMSRKGNCWDNAPTESFFGTLKQELVYHRDFGSRQQARQEVFEYIEVWYSGKCVGTHLSESSASSFESGLYESRPV